MKIENNGKKNITDVLALTPMQEGMLFHYLKYPGSNRYIEQLSLQLSGEIDIPAITRSWHVVIENNEMLRAVFRWEKLKNPVQMILKEYSIIPGYHDLTSSPADIQEKLISEIKLTDREKKFDLHIPPIRITICRLSPNKAEMIITNHHILYDGWSNGIILKEFFCIYNDLLAAREIRKFAKPQFKDFLKWIREQQNKEEQEKFWKNYLLSGKDATITPPVSNKKIKRREIINIGRQNSKLPAGLTENLDSFVKKNKITLSSLLSSAWGLLLQKYNEDEDVIFDTTVSGRNPGLKGIEDMVGMFINTLPMRVQTQAGESISGLLKRQYDQLQEREAYENTPLEDINEYVEFSFQHRINTLFTSVLVLENYPLDKQLMQEKGKLSVDSYSVSGMTQYDVTLIITIFDDIELNITYNKDLFDEDTLNRLTGHFINILKEILANPLKVAAEIIVKPDAERKQLLERLVAVEEACTIEEIPYVPPRDALENKLAAVFSEILNVGRRDEYFKSIGIHDNFFDFGGHSLKATLLSARIHRDFDVKIPLEEIFKKPTIAQLAQFIREASSQVYPGYESIEPAKEKEFYMSSSSQQRMYALQQLDPGSTAYNVSTVMEIAGVVDNKVKSIFQAAFCELIRRHEILRTSFHLVNGEPMQKIHDLRDPGEINFEIEYEDFNPGKAVSAEPQTCEFDIRPFIRPFDLSHAPLMRIKLVKKGIDLHWLILSMHHIITDGFSMNIFAAEFAALCRGEKLPAVKKQYKDYSEWQYNRLQSGKLDNCEKFWLNEFYGELPVLNMLTDYPRPLVQRFEGDRFHFVLDKDTTLQLYRLARKMDVTLFIILLTAFNILLYKYTGQEDLIIGTTVAGRNYPGLENMIGLFIETLALRNHPNGDKTFADFLLEVRTHTLAAYDHESYPFKELIKKIGDAGEMSRNPLFDVMLIVQNVDVPKLELEELTFTPIPYYSQESKLDITLEALDMDGELKFHIEYSTALFKPGTIERFAGHYLNILKETVNNPAMRISEIEILGLEEKKLILEDFKWSHWTPDPGKYSFDKRIEEIFEEQVLQTPDNIAIVYENQHISYRQLNEKANSIAKIIEEL